MKKILISLLTCAAAMTSCDMDLQPVGVLDSDNAVETVYDCEQFRNGMYVSLRSMGNTIGTISMQGDEFYGITINGNLLNNVTSGNIMSNDGDLSGIWASCYSVISDANFFIERAESLLERPTIVGHDAEFISRYIGEAKFVRAYAYYMLSQYYCNSYTKVDPTSELTGVPICDVYAPSGDKSTYPGRSSLADVYTFIENDLKDAYDAISTWESIPDYEDPFTGLPVLHRNYLITSTPILNSWVVKAMQCRMALLKGDYRAAKDLADDIIKNGLYKLADRNNYAKMWTDDVSDEIIFMPFANNSSEPAASLGGNWNSSDVQKAFFIPTAYVENNLYSSRDIRLSTFLTTRNLLVDGSLVTSPIFNKYPGNSTLQVNPDGSNELRNKMKMFRLSEIYLILAEASAELGEDTDANAALNELRSNRIQRYSTSTVYSGTDLRDEIRLERRRELIGEGFRISDLRRWGLGFDRTDVNYSNPTVASIVVVSSRITYNPDDYRYVWPIPASEMEVNPQLKGQQNPGYGN